MMEKLTLVTTALLLCPVGARAATAQWIDDDSLSPAEPETFSEATEEPFGLLRSPHLTSFEQVYQAGLVVGAAAHPGLATVNYALEADFKNLSFVIPFGTGVGVGGQSQWVFGNMGVEIRSPFSGNVGSVSWYAGPALGAWLPTATDGGQDAGPEDLGKALVLGFLSGANHAYDPGRYLPYSFTLRPTGAAAITSGWFAAEAELGFDFIIPADFPGEGERQAVLHTGIAPGLIFGDGKWGGYAEVGRLQPLGNDAVGTTILGANMRYLGRHMTGGLSLTVPMSAALDRLGVGAMAQIGARF